MCIRDYKNVNAYDGEPKPGLYSLFFFSWELDEMMKIDATLASVH